MIRTLDAVRTLDEGNTRARADVVVLGKTVLSAVPVGHLLYLESRLDDLGTFLTACRRSTRPRNGGRPRSPGSTGPSPPSRTGWPRSSRIIRLPPPPTSTRRRSRSIRSTK